MRCAGQPERLSLLRCHQVPGGVSLLESPGNNERSESVSTGD